MLQALLLWAPAGGSARSGPFSCPDDGEGCRTNNFFFIDFSRTTDPILDPEILKTVPNFKRRQLAPAGPFMFRFLSPVLMWFQTPCHSPLNLLQMTRVLIMMTSSLVGREDYNNVSVQNTFF